MVIIRVSNFEGIESMQAVDYLSAIKWRFWMSHCVRMFVRRFKFIT